MKLKTFLSLLLMSTSLIAFSKTWTVGNSGNTFNPATLTISLGDTVKFVIAGVHDAREVSETTWNTNGNTALPGGFQTPFGGGLVLPAQLGTGTHFYVCSVHASFGMKGRIIVETATGVEESFATPQATVSPNPSNGLFNIRVEGPQADAYRSVEIYNAQGQMVLQSELSSQNCTLDMGTAPRGLYWIKIYGKAATLTKRALLF